MKLQSGRLKGHGADEVTVWKVKRTYLPIELQSGRLK